MTLPTRLWPPRWTTGASFILTIALASTSLAQTPARPSVPADSASTSADNAPVSVRDLQRLAEGFEEADQPFLGYAFRMAHYELAADSSARLASGTAALNGAFFAGRYDEAEHALRRLAADFPNHRRTFRWQYAVLLLQDSRFDDARLALDAAELSPSHRDTLGERIAIVESILALHDSDADRAFNALAPIDTDIAFGPRRRSARRRVSSSRTPRGCTDHVPVSSAGRHA